MAVDTEQPVSTAVENFAEELRASAGPVLAFSADSWNRFAAELKDR
jgi:hypothetical protein